jgi:hypothetical protein
MDEAQQQREFKVLYTAVTTAAIYTGTFLACFFWPSFLAYLFFPDELVRSELVAVFLLLPLGMTILGLLDGFKIGLLNFALVVLPVVASFFIILGLGRSDNEFIKLFIMSVIALSYMVAALLASKRRLKAYG